MAKIIYFIIFVMILKCCIGQYVSPISDSAIQNALNDRRYLMRQLKCALGEVPCDPVGKRLRILAPFVLRGACPQCSPAEKVQIQRTLAYVQKNFPREWYRLLQTYAG